MSKLQVIYEPQGRAGEYAEWAANLYSGCGHGCRYCWAPDVLRMDRTEFHLNPQPRKDVLRRFREDCEKLATEVTESTEKSRILLCFTCDPYQPIEREHRLTREAIRIAHKHGLGVQILTKAGLLAQRDFDLLGPRDAFAQTLTFTSIEDSERWEPKAALPTERALNLKLAHERGIPTWVSLEPVIDPAQSLRLIEWTAEFVDLFKVGKWNYDRRADAIDWKRFGNEAVELLERLGKKYYIKEDLKQYLTTGDTSLAARRAGKHGERQRDY